MKKFPIERIPNELSSGVNTSTALSLLASKKTKVTQKEELIIDNIPLYCFSIFNNSAATHTRQLLNAIYLDSLFNSNQEVSLGGRLEQIISPIQSGLIDLTLKSAKYSISLQKQIRNYISKINDIAGTADIYLLSIGDSLTEQTLKNSNGDNDSYWGSCSKIVLEAEKFKIDKPTMPKIVSVGHREVISRTTTYKGQTITVASATAAMSGWAGSNFLYHAYRLSSIDVTATDFVNPSISYYLLGLKGSTGADYTGTTTQQEQIRTTVMGKLAVDKHSNVYDWMKTQPEWNSVFSYPNDSYTNTSTQNNRIDTFFEWMLDNPKNPFYSKSKARQVGSLNAFSISTYLARYPSVTTPTRVTLNFGENDIWLYPNATFTAIAQTVKDIATVITSELTNCKVLVWTNPHPGSNFPELCTNGVRYTKVDTNNSKSQLRNALVSTLGVSQNTPKVGNIYYVDTYMFTYPLSYSYDYPAELAGVKVDYEGKLNGDNQQLSGVHLGLMSHACTGTQLLGAIYYSILN